MAAKEAIEKANPIIPSKKIDPLPNLSLNLPQNGPMIKGEPKKRSEILKVTSTPFCFLGIAYNCFGMFGFGCRVVLSDLLQKRL